MKTSTHYTTTGYTMMVWRITYVLLFTSAALACDFPDFLQSKRDGPKREWHVQHLEYHRSREHRYTHKVTFVGSTMHAVVDGNKHTEHVHHHPKSYTRRCVLEIEPGQFLVTHNVAGGSTQRYSCVEFIRRSDNVFQVKQSELSPVQDPRLCADKIMTINNWPFINKVGLFSQYEPCPLEGGYNARFFDKKKHVGYCDVYEGETRVESECMKGEGMYFRFRYNECVPDDLHMDITQKVYCMANWEDENFVYNVIRHNSKDRQWCLRYPRKHGAIFNAELFRDIVCDPAYHPNETAEYFTISMFRDTPQSLSDLCRDDYEGCSYWSSPCKAPGSSNYMTCAKTCGVCNHTRPATCSLPLNLRGEWLETNGLGHDIVDIKDRGFSKYQYDDFKCIRWHNKPYERKPEFVEEMVVTILDNGCWPRFSCVQFKKHSPSVLHYKLSLPKIWPFYDADHTKIDCSSFHYNDEETPAGDAHRSRHFKSLISMDAITNVNCDLDGPISFTAIDDNGVLCHGQLMEDTTSVYRHKHMKLLLHDCPKQKPQQTFACLDSNRHGYLSKHIIITEAVDNTNEYQCWLFPVSPAHSFYLLPMRHCNEGAAQRILSGAIKPLGVYKVTLMTTTSTTTTTTTTSTTPAVSPNIKVENIVSVPTYEDVVGDYEDERDRLNDFLMRMNDMSRPGRKYKKKVSAYPDDNENRDRYAHLSAVEDHPEEGKLVSEKNSKPKAKAAKQSPGAELNKRQDPSALENSGYMCSFSVFLTITTALGVMLH